MKTEIVVQDNQLTRGLDVFFKFESLEEANTIRDNLLELMDKYRWISIADVYDLTGVVPKFEMHMYGWTSFDDLLILNTTEWAILNIPNAQLLFKGGL